MKPSLEEERRALLAQIEASRAVYRRMLSGAPSDAGSGISPTDPKGMQKGKHSEKIVGFPRSRTMRWMMDHPVAVAASVSLLVWAAPRWWASYGRAKAGKSLDQLDRPVERSKAGKNERRQTDRSPPAEGTGRALLTAAALLMRNPATMRTLGRAAGSAWHWFQQRRAHRSDIH